MKLRHVRIVQVADPGDDRTKFTVIHPAAIFIDGERVNNVLSITVDKKGPEPATVTMKFTPEELDVEMDCIEQDPHD